MSFLRSGLPVVLAAATAVVLPVAAQTRRVYTPDLASLQTHPVPDWYNDAKLGIFVHWGLYSVPGFAPPAGSHGKVSQDEALKYDAYAEWYYNTMRIPGSPTAEFHRQHFKDGDYYGTFTPLFNKASHNWNADTWARLFRDTGARYAVLTSKHHEGFCLWPSEVPNPNQQGLHANRDLVGDFMTAMRKVGLRAGLYYSGGYDWTFDRGPLILPMDYRAAQPQTHAYGVYADAQAEELTRRYHPDILWNDISWPTSGNAIKVIADYYNAVPEGLVDDRWGIHFGDFGSPEYQTRKEIDSKKFEECRGLGASFGYNRAEGEAETIEPQRLIDLFVDVVSKNGNLLLDVGPMADGSIPPLQLDRLHKLGAWMKVNGEAIYGTRPWVRAEGTTEQGTPVRFTHKGEFTYAILLRKPTQATVTVEDLALRTGSTVKLLGVTAPVAWHASGTGTTFTLPQNLPSDYAVALRLEAAR